MLPGNILDLEHPALEDASEDVHSEHGSLEDDDFEPALAAPECQRCRTVYERSGKVPKLFQSKPIQKGSSRKLAAERCSGQNSSA